LPASQGRRDPLPHGSGWGSAFTEPLKSGVGSGTKMAQINDASSSERYMRTASALDAMHCICTRFVSPSSPASKILSRLVSSGWGNTEEGAFRSGCFKGKNRAEPFFHFFWSPTTKKRLRQSMKPRITHLVCDLRQTAEVAPLPPSASGRISSLRSTPVDTEGGIAATATAAAPQRTDQSASTAPPSGGGMPGRGAARYWRSKEIAPLEGVRVWGAEWPREVSGMEAKLRACTAQFRWCWLG
jgi:hypothetical protein